MEPTFQLPRVAEPISLKDKAYNAIKSAILSLKLKPGDPLVESDLAQQLGISKTPVRDALLELEREGFVTKVLFKGTYVTEVTLKDVREVFQLRAVLEGLAARLAAPLLSARELEKAEKILAAAEAALAEGDIGLCSKHGKRFHNLIINKADNQWLQSITRNLDDHLQRFRLLSDQINGRLNKSLKEHRKILEALQRRDPVAAEEAARGHLFSVLLDLSEDEDASES
ncbi:MAG: GntR family transcriptional regulator [Anaerolineae bacterium]|nr:GntR family transcriptional regulator [Anaerolineae bacterium]